jgi:ribosome-binding protein aMBF1 (putative translation factor)
MEVCAICEREVSPENLKEVISGKGITKVCNHCYSEDMPLFNKPTDENFESIYKRKTVYNRLSDSAGLNSEDHRRRVYEFNNRKISKDESLRRIANRNYEMDARKSPKNEGLVDNFHWIITRARRLKKLSQSQFALEIGEPESAIAMAEKGFIPVGSNILVQKIENSLRIRISKKIPDKEMSPFEKIQREYLDKIKNEGNFDPFITKDITVSDLVPKKKRWSLFGRRKKKEENVSEINELDILDEVD